MISKQTIRLLKANVGNLGEIVTVNGWVKTVRKQKAISFINISDGSDLKGIQVIVDNATFDLENSLATGASVQVRGSLVEERGNKEVQVNQKNHSVKVLGGVDQNYPLQKKKHTIEFLRENLPLRSRSNTISSMLRMRSIAMFEILRFFQKEDFVQIHTPILTGLDCEGAGEMFRVIVDPHKPNKEFFDTKAYLTVSGQLQAEIFASSFSKVFTFGPTFRAENSNTARHLAEFWMLEPEIAFSDIHDAMNLAEGCVKHVLSSLQERCAEEISFFEASVDSSIRERYSNTLNHNFERITYTKAIEILKNSNKKFIFPVEWGLNLQSEHERYLAEEYFKRPVFVMDYPTSIKAFYMSRNDDGRTVAAYDLLVPRIGELIGGSVREDRYDVLKKIMIEHKLLTNEECEDSSNNDYKNLKWYLDLRKQGSVPHSGWGLGFERLLLYATGLENIRDVIPIPRTPNNLRC